MQLEEDTKNLHTINRILVAGDSWTYGSEIRDPRLPSSINDWDTPNDHYRLPRIWPNKLGKLMGVTDIVNISYPAASNDMIVRNTVGWLTQEYLAPKKSTENLFVIVGLTSPERKDFYYKDKKRSFWFTLWPMWKHKYPQEPLNRFAELYTTHLYNIEESTHRYLNQIFYLQTLFNQYKIKHLFFQAFYQRSDMNIHQWTDDPYTRHYRGQPDQMIWDMIDPIRFMHKDDEIHSFHNYIRKKDLCTQGTNAIKGMHPSELGHTWWAEHVYKYLQENKLW
jgi:Family of unknown function (DUF6071)